MRLLPALLAAATLLAAAPALAGPQQDRMTSCNEKAAGLKGGERKAFMKKCLSGDDAGTNAQQARMKRCNAEAKQQGLSGEKRKAFMSGCLKG